MRETAPSSTRDRLRDLGSVNKCVWRPPSAGHTRIPHRSVAAAPGGGGLLSGLRVPTQLLALHVNQPLGGRGSAGPCSQVGENRQSEVPREVFFPAHMSQTRCGGQVWGQS